MDILAKILEKTLANAEIVLVSSIIISFAWHFLFRKRRFIVATIVFLAGMFSVGFLGGILSWISGLGGDSFLETNRLNDKETLFWLSTFLSTLSQMLMPFDRTSILIATEVAAMSSIIFAVTCWRPVALRGLAIILIAGISYLVYMGYAGFASGRAYIAQLQSQFDSNPQGFKASRDIDLFVYIGESTSSLNMSLYGYPLPTTPQLDKIMQGDAGFLRFKRVRSTHTHTSPSLLRALTITSPQSNGELTQWGIGSVLKQSGLSPKLHSVQPLNGSFANFSRFIFDGMSMDLVADDRYKGNYVATKLKDHLLLEKALQDSGVIFFHSYAGHGEYLDLIDKALSDPVKKPTMRFAGMYGSLFSRSINSDLPRNASDYDQAITYIDRNVSRAIKNIKSRSKPAVFVYFSDHGEAVYAKRSHDSSIYIDEMTTIPMVLYFNDAYRRKYRDTFAAYRQAAQADRTRLLDQISPTLLDILHVKSTYPLDVPNLASTEKHPRPYIVERKTLSGLSRIDLEYDPAVGFSKAKFFGGTPEPTYISIVNEQFGDQNEICYHRTNSYAKALRAANTARCLEFDLVVDGQELNVYHPPTTATGFNIEHIFSIAQARKNSLWIDSKNLDQPSACNALASYLEQNHSRVGQVFVEFPSEAASRLGELESCGRRLKAVGARTSYYVPTHWLVPCAENSTKNAAICKDLDNSVQKAMSSGVFTDLSFDFRGYPAMKHIKGAENFKWNTWAIKAQDFHRFPRQDFSFIIMDTSTDPNTY